jgi:hypothetical protein
MFIIHLGVRLFPEYVIFNFATLVVVGEYLLHIAHKYIAQRYRIINRKVIRYITDKVNGLKIGTLKTKY